MEVRIGIKHSPRELAFETDTSAKELQERVIDASKNGDTFATFTDAKGRSYVVDVESIAYLEVGAEGGRKVGFIN